MRQTIKGLVAAIAVVTASAAPAMACGGGGLFSAFSSCSPCQSYNPCGGSYNSGYYGGGYGYGVSSYQRLPDPVQQYYYVNQGPVYSGPASYAPAPTYQESGYATASRYEDEAPAAYSYRSHRQYRSWRPRTSYYHAPRMNHRYGYAPRHSYHRYSAPHHYGHRQPVLRRYY